MITSNNKCPLNNAIIIHPRNQWQQDVEFDANGNSPEICICVRLGLKKNRVGQPSLGSEKIPSVKTRIKLPPSVNVLTKFSFEFFNVSSGDTLRFMHKHMRSGACVCANLRDGEREGLRIERGRVMERKGTEMETGEGARRERDRGRGSEGKLDRRG